MLKGFGREGCRARWETRTPQDCWHLAPASREPPLQAPTQHRSVVMAEHKAGFACARHKPPHETKTTAEVSEQHLSATPASTSTSLHHARSNLLRDDPLIKDTCIEHKGLMFAGDAVQSSKCCLRKPRPWDPAAGKMLLLHMQFHTSLHRSCDSPARGVLCHRRNTCA